MGGFSEQQTFDCDTIFFKIQFGKSSWKYTDEDQTIPGLGILSWQATTWSALQGALIFHVMFPAHSELRMKYVLSWIWKKFYIKGHFLVTKDNGLETNHPRSSLSPILRYAIYYRFQM